MDICGPLVETERGNLYILVVTDHFSKYTEAYPLQDQTAQTVAQIVVQNWFLKYGPPVELHTDQGSNFNSALMQAVCRFWRIFKTRTSPYHPQGDGQAERYNRYMMKTVGMLVQDRPEDWDLILPYVVYAYNGTLHESLQNFTPNFMWFGRELRSMIGELVPCVEDKAMETYGEYALRTRKFLEIAYAAARENLGKSAERTKHYHDRNAMEYIYEPGDEVLYEQFKHCQKGTGKMRQVYEGPWRVLDKLGDCNYRIARHARDTPRVVHHNKLRHYKENPEDRSTEIPDWVLRMSETFQRRMKIEGIRFTKRSLVPGYRPTICCKRRARIVKAQKKRRIQFFNRRARPGRPRIPVYPSPETDATSVQRTKCGRVVKPPSRYDS
jgi:hypothetical protein